MPDEPREVADRLEQPRKKPAEARNLLGSGFADAAAHAAYYAAFHAAQALLAREGSHPTTHRGVISEVGKRYVQERSLEPAEGAILQQLLDTRFKADYGVLDEVSPEEAEEAVAASAEFVGAAERAASS